MKVENYRSDISVEAISEMVKHRDIRALVDAFQHSTGRFVPSPLCSRLTDLVQDGLVNDAEFFELMGHRENTLEPMIVRLEKFERGKLRAKRQDLDNWEELIADPTMAAGLARLNAVEREELEEQFKAGIIDPVGVRKCLKTPDLLEALRDEIQRCHAMRERERERTGERRLT